MAGELASLQRPDQPGTRSPTTAVQQALIRGNGFTLRRKCLVTAVWPPGLWRPEPSVWAGSRDRSLHVTLSTACAKVPLLHFTKRFCPDSHSGAP